MERRHAVDILGDRRIRPIVVDSDQLLGVLVVDDSEARASDDERRDCDQNRSECDSGSLHVLSSSRFSSAPLGIQENAKSRRQDASRTYRGAKTTQRRKRPSSSFGWLASVYFAGTSGGRRRKLESMSTSAILFRG
jgi:hypothetical protein